MSYSEEFKAGWALARAQYQSTGGVQPHPPEKPAEKPEPEVAPAKKAAPGKKTGGA